MSLSKAYSIVFPLVKTKWRGNGGNKMLEIIFGRVAEAIYLSLFMIFTKRLKEKRILFIVLMIAEYLILYACFPYRI